MPRPTDASQHQQVLDLYLLELLPPLETERLDEASIVDDDFAVRLADAENDLIDAYVTCALDRDHCRQFEAVYLTSSHNRRRVESARRFRAAIDRAASDQATPWTTFVRPLLAAAATLIVASGFVMLYGDHGFRRPLQRAPLDPIDSAAGLSAPAVVLVPQVRGAGRSPTAVITDETGEVTFDLRLESHEYNQYLVTLADSRDAGPVWQSRPLVPFTRGAVSLVSIRVPASVFTSPHYSFELVGVDGSGRRAAIGGYAVQIERR